MEKKLDIYDMKIMQSLELDSRISASALSKKLRLPKETANYRIKRLKREGYIKSFYAILDTALLGLKQYMIFFRFTRITASIEKQITEYFSEHERIISLRTGEGAFDMAIITVQENENGIITLLKDFSERYGAYIIEKSINAIVRTHKLSPCTQLNKGRADDMVIDFTSGRGIAASRPDWKILRVISGHARARAIDIARLSGQDPKGIRYRIKKMEESGIIRGYSAEIGLEKLNMQSIQIDMSLKDISVAKGIIEFFRACGAGHLAHEMIGRHDLSVELCIKDSSQLRKIIEDFKADFMQYCISYDITHSYESRILNNLGPG